MKLPPLSGSPGLLLCALCGFSSPVFAQTSVAAATDDDAAEPVVQLDPFTIAGSPDEGYFSTSATAFGRVVMKLENVPQKMDVYNAQFIADIAPSSISDITRYATAVNYGTAERSNGGMMVRGFNASLRRNGENLAGLNTGLAGLETIEQTEIVKGPSAVLYGAGQPGGVINFVTKIPKFRRETVLNGQIHSFGGYTASIDTTGPIGSTSRKGGPIAAYRFVIVNEDRKEYQDNDDFYERQVFFGKILIRPAPWVFFTLEAEQNMLNTAFFNSQVPLQADYTASRSAPYSSAVPNPALVREPFFLPVEWTYQTDGTFRKAYSDIYQATATIDKDFGRLGRWTLRSFYSLSTTDAIRSIVDVGNSAYPQPVTAADLGKVVNRNQTVTAADVAANRLWIPSRSLRRLYDISPTRARNQFDLTGQFETGPIQHTLLVGTELDLGEKSTFHPGGNGSPGGFSRLAYEGAAGRAYATWVDQMDYAEIPVDWDDVRSAANPGGAVRQSGPGASVARDDIGFDVPFITEKPDSFYVFDALSMLDDRLHISLGLRHDEIEQSYRDASLQTQTATATQWTRRAGFVYKFRPSAHVYALYNESFNPNPTGAMNAWQTALAPQDGEQKEAGVRLTFFENRLAIDASYFEISNTNVYQSDSFGKLPTRFPPGTDLSTIPDTFLWPNTPGLENKGFDIDAKIRISRDTQMIVAYTRNDMLATGTITQQLALGSPTYRPNNVPENQFSFWGKWTPSSGRLKAFSFNLGYRYVGDRTGGPTGNVAQIALSDYGMFDAGIGYRHKRWSFNLAIRNLTDEYAFRAAPGSDRLYPEKPRHAVLSITTRL